MVICVAQKKNPYITMLRALFRPAKAKENSSAVFTEVIAPAVEHSAGG